MALNIKNEDVHRLVEELAKLTGESQTTAVRNAVAEKLSRVKGDKEQQLKKLMQIAHECAAGMKEPFRSMTHEQIDELLYDENGLPK